MLPDSCGSPRSHKHPKEQSQSPLWSPRRLASRLTTPAARPVAVQHPQALQPPAKAALPQPPPSHLPFPSVPGGGHPRPWGGVWGCITQPGIGCAAPMALLIAEHPAPAALGWGGGEGGGTGGSARCLRDAKGTGASCIALVAQGRSTPRAACRQVGLAARSELSLRSVSYREETPFPQGSPLPKPCRVPW